ncbi:MAG: DMT family transporter [Burkholderiales bacterium]|jgi:drug/metabolite transporter (DMT)-like permease
MTPKPRSAALVGTVCYLTCSVFWGLNIPLSSTLLKHFDPFWLPMARYVIASAMLGAWVAATLGPRQLRSPIPLTRVAALSAMVSGFLLLFNLGLLYTHPVTAAAVIAGSPVYVAVVMRTMTGVRLAPGFWTATALTLIGAGIAVHGRAEAIGSGFRLQGGEPALIGSIACWTVYSILAQRWFRPDVPQLRRTWLTSLGAIPWLLAVWGAARAAGLAPAPNLSPDAGTLASLVVSAVVCTALATVAWNTGVARLGIAAGGMWQNTIPVFAVLISLVGYGVVPTASQVLGGAVVLAGVAWMQRRSLRAAAAPA